MNRLKFVLFYNNMTLIYLTIAEFFYEILAHSGQFLDDGSILHCTLLCYFRTTQSENIF